MRTSPLPGTTPDFIHLIHGHGLLVIGFFLFAYLLGSIPFGLILTKYLGRIDIRKTGSGNIGATNVLRSGKKWLALGTLLLDGGKGALAVAIGAWIEPNSYLPLAMGFCAILGHCFPIWLKFKGGKGVATAFGVLLVQDWSLGVSLLAIWVIMAGVFRFSSLAALTAFVAAPVLAWFFDKHALLVPLIALAVLIAYNHRENMQRILQNTESRIGPKS